MNKTLFKQVEGKGKFFLMRDVPEFPNLDDRTGKWYKETGGYLDPSEWYDRELKACISEALKNGEIVNPEVLSYLKSDADHHKTQMFATGFIPKNFFKDGDTFDIPEGMGFEVCNELRLCTCGCGDELPTQTGIRLLPEKPAQLPTQIKKNVMNKALWLKDCLNNGWSKDQLDGLSDVWDKFKDEEGNLKPEQKEESQWELFEELYSDMSVRGNFGINREEKQDLKEYLISKFTIKRK